MDPFSAEGELLNMHNAFYQGQYQTVIESDTSSLSAENTLPARVLRLRAQLAIGQIDEVLADIEGETEVPDLAAVQAIAQYTVGQTSDAERQVEKLASSASANTTVQILGGTVLQAAGKSDEALSLLSKHHGSLEAVALIVQIHLQQNRTDLAVKEVQAARRWAQDSLLVNIAESWGGEKYQQAFYVFEEMAQAPSSSAAKSLISQAVAEVHLGRLQEAEAALDQVLQKNPREVEAISNYIVLKTISGKDTSELIASLESVAPKHAYLTDISSKSSLFDQAARKYSAKVA